MTVAPNNNLEQLDMHECSTNIRLQFNFGSLKIDKVKSEADVTLSIARHLQSRLYENRLYLTSKAPQRKAASLLCRMCSKSFSIFCCFRAQKIMPFRQNTYQVIMRP